MIHYNFYMMMVVEDGTGYTHVFQVKDPKHYSLIQGIIAGGGSRYVTPGRAFYTVLIHVTGIQGGEYSEKAVTKLDKVQSRGDTLKYKRIEITDEIEALALDIFDDFCDSSALDEAPSLWGAK